jgi:hypothetical protein
MLEDLKEQLNLDKQISLRIKVHASAHESRIKAVLSDQTIKVDINKAPEDGKANEVLIKLLAKEFAVPNNCVSIIIGKFSSDKSVLLGC